MDKLTDEEITEVFREAVRNAIEQAKKAGNPICCWDSELKESYILYPDGRREYAGISESERKGKAEMESYELIYKDMPITKEEIYADLEESRKCFERGEYQDFDDAIEEIKKKYNL